VAKESPTLRKPASEAKKAANIGTEEDPKAMTGEKRAVKNVEEDTCPKKKIKTEVSPATTAMAPRRFGKSLKKAQKAPEIGQCSEMVATNNASKSRKTKLVNEVEEQHTT
jgi:hypothetical protein